MSEATLKAIDYKRGELKVLDQLLLPHTTVYEEVKTNQDGHHVIRSMKVRGAPAIAIVAALTLAVELHKRSSDFRSAKDAITFIHESLEYLKTSRPTAVNLFDAAEKLWNLVKDLENETASKIIETYTNAAEDMLVNDVKDNMAIGEAGLTWLSKYYPNKEKINVLTHCNTGSLATAGYGTALGVIRSLHGKNRLGHAYCTETRPYNQGSRLTAYELTYENMPSTLITDSMAAFLISGSKVDAIIVGADRVAHNGDTANKIGTYQLAILAKHFNIPFIVAAPTTSIDLNTLSGKDIPIEERKSDELTRVSGLDKNNQLVDVQVGHKKINVWNPAFDVTPANLISSIITEKGALVKVDGQQEFNLKVALDELK
ncbi:putative translation initiation factor [Neoconidiobolus thromboides FSU 785]|nr:putative translation initiation factor [Neoconidiobolus thromboides FSU 785]